MTVDVIISKIENLDYKVEIVVVSVLKEIFGLSDSGEHDMEIGEGGVLHSVFPYQEELQQE